MVKSHLATAPVLRFLLMRRQRAARRIADAQRWACLPRTRTPAQPRSTPRSATLLAAWTGDATARLDLRGDPVLLFCLYESGVISEGDNPWGLAHHRRFEDGVVVSDSLDEFVALYGDACAVYGLC